MNHTIVSREEWLGARKALLAKERRSIVCRVRPAPSLRPAINSANTKSHGVCRGISRSVALPPASQRRAPVHVAARDCSRAW